MVDNKVRYEINVAAAKRANVDISSKLLKLAKIVGAGIDN
jgi:YfiR/HmsC-like